MVGRSVGVNVGPTYIWEGGGGGGGGGGSSYQ